VGVLYDWNLNSGYFELESHSVAIEPSHYTLLYYLGEEALTHYWGYLIYVHTCISKLIFGIKPVIQRIINSQYASRVVMGTTELVHDLYESTTNFIKDW